MSISHPCCSVISVQGGTPERVLLTVVLTGLSEGTQQTHTFLESYAFFFSAYMRERGRERRGGEGRAERSVLPLLEF